MTLNWLSRSGASFPFRIAKESSMLKILRIIVQDNNLSKAVVFRGFVPGRSGFRLRQGNRETPETSGDARRAHAVFQDAAFRNAFTNGRRRKKTARGTGRGNAAENGSSPGRFRSAPPSCGNPKGHHNGIRRVLGTRIFSGNPVILLFKIRPKKRCRR